MPARTFAVMILSVILAAGATIAVFAVLDLPLVALGVAALLGSLILGYRRWR